MAEKLTGTGFWGWLGRQVGHVKKAVETDVTPPAPNAQAELAARAETSDAPAGGAKIVYQTNSIEEVPLPDQPGVKLRRTIIDEVIVEEVIVESGGDGKAEDHGRDARATEEKKTPPGPQDNHGVH